MKYAVQISVFSLISKESSDVRNIINLKSVLRVKSVTGKKTEYCVGEKKVQKNT